MYGKLEYRASPISGQRRLDQFEPMDVIRLGADEPPLRGAELNDFFHQSVIRWETRYANYRHQRTGRVAENALTFYERDGAMYFAFWKCRTKNWKPKWLGNRYSTDPCPDKYMGTYRAYSTKDGEEWIRCTQKVPDYLNDQTSQVVTARNARILTQTWSVNCPGVNKTVYASASDLKHSPGAAIYDSGSWRIAGTEDILTHDHGGPLGLPSGLTCRKGILNDNGGIWNPCTTTGYDVIDNELGGAIRRYITPNWANGNEWFVLTRELVTRTIEINGFFSSNAIPTHASKYLSLETSDAYPGALFIGGLSEDVEPMGETRSGGLNWANRKYYGGSFHAKGFS